ncbi:MAG: restriction endonuclease subunit S [Propionibacteriaceae bacterium]|jgi:type I restriction enzyme S subunit|nr:restriction endonuclease subunit S [Propionibacteriaceae bacterium]
MSETATLGELQNRGSLLLNDGYRTKTTEMGPAGIPILRVAEVVDGAIHPASADRIRNEFRSAIGLKMSQPGDVLLTTKGTVGRRVIMPQTPVQYAYSPQLCFFRVLDDSLDNKWLYYWLGSDGFWSQAGAFASQTDMAPYIALRDLRSVEVPIPPLAEQRRIAAVLGSFDDLIETNWALIELLAQWVHSSVSTASELALLADVADVAKPKQVRPRGSVAHYSLPAFDNGACPDHVGGATIQSSKLPLSGPTVLVSRLNPQWERCWMAYPSDNAVASTEFVPLMARFDVSPEEVWAVASSSGFWEQMRSHVTGTTGSHQRVDKAELLAMSVPDVRTLDPTTRSGIVDAVQGVQALRDEIADLTRARDELLPLLMSGRVRVDESLEVG